MGNVERLWGQDIALYNSRPSATDATFMKYDIAGIDRG
jgi:hypothetical protein